MTNKSAVRVLLYIPSLADSSFPRIFTNLYFLFVSQSCTKRMIYLAC